MFFHAWGRRDGDKHNETIFPIFSPCTEKSVLPRKGGQGKQCPIGSCGQCVRHHPWTRQRAFQELIQGRQQPSFLQRRLPCCCVFHGLLSGKSPLTIRWNAKFTTKTASDLRNAAAEVEELALEI